MEELCDNCYYVEFCEKDKVRERHGICPFYYDEEQSCVEDLVEDARDEYRSAWFEYIADFE